ncbi:MAG: NAD(P)-binding domain-containing protein [Myxococcota bacterium]
MIGAGAAGLCCARELVARGHEPVVFERADHVGGVWAYDPRVEDDPLGLSPTQRIHASMYEALRTNLPRRLMSFRDDSFTVGDQEFPGHAAVGEYLRGFVDRQRLESFLRLEHEVVRVVPRLESGRPWAWPETMDAARWDVVVRHAGVERTEQFGAIAVCNGHFSEPNVPAIDGLEVFPGPTLHSHNYRVPDSFADQQVLIIGAKASGVDISRDIATVAARVHLCARGHVGCEHVGVRGNIERRANVARLHADRAATLDDGTRLEGIDAVILCTGYRYHFGFLDPAARIVDIVDNNVEPLWLDLVAARLPTAAFIGLPFMVVPFALFERQAAFFGGLLAGTVALPSLEARLADARQKNERRDQLGIARRHRLRLGDGQLAYCRELSRRCGYPELPEWFSRLHEVVRAARREHPDDYRDRALPDL